MKNNYNDYVFKNGKPIYQFDEMYKNCDDPWNIGKKITESIDYKLITAIIEKYKMKIEKNRPDILEIGSGKGDFSKILSDLGRVTGVEISPTAINYAIEMNSKTDAEFICADITKPDFHLDKKYDFIIFFRVIWYLIDNLDICLNNLYNSMTDKGIGIFDINFYKGEYYGKSVISNTIDYINFLEKYFTILEHFEHFDMEMFNDYSIIICQKNVKND